MKSTQNSLVRNTDRVFVTGDTAAAVTLRLISRQPAMSPTGFSMMTYNDLVHLASDCGLDGIDTTGRCEKIKQGLGG